jgi:predicted RNA binding protein YcfA (HicA-like mRNA interferase family)
LPKILPVKANHLIKILEAEGFKVIRQKGSHLIFNNPEKNRIVAHMH